VRVFRVHVNMIQLVYADRKEDCAQQHIFGYDDVADALSLCNCLYMDHLPFLNASITVSPIFLTSYPGGRCLRNSTAFTNGTISRHLVWWILVKFQININKAQEHIPFSLCFLWLCFLWLWNNWLNAVVWMNRMVTVIDLEGPVSI